MVFDHSNGINWRDKLAPRLIAGIVTALLLIYLGLLAIAWGYSEQTKRQWDSDQYSGEYTAYTYGPAYDACVRLPVDRQNNCKAEANKKRRANERDEQNLVAQQTSAIWTFLMGTAAIVGMILSAIGVFLVWTTFNETRNGNVLTKKQIADAWRLGKAQAEAVIVIQTVNIDKAVASDGVPQFVIDIKNVGNTPAINFKCEGLWIISKEEIAKRGRLPFAKAPNVYAAQEHTACADSIPEQTFGDMEIDFLNDAFITFIGRVSYDTMFDESRTIIVKRKGAIRAIMRSIYRQGRDAAEQIITGEEREIVVVTSIADKFEYRQYSKDA